MDTARHVRPFPPLTVRHEDSGAWEAGGARGPRAARLPAQTELQAAGRGGGTWGPPLKEAKGASVLREAEGKGERYTRQDSGHWPSPSRTRQSSAQATCARKPPEAADRTTQRGWKESPSGLTQKGSWARPVRDGKLHKTPGRNLPQKGDKISAKHHTCPTHPSLKVRPQRMKRFPSDVTGTLTRAQRCRTNSHTHPHRQPGKVHNVHTQPKMAENTKNPKNMTQNKENSQ